MADVLIVCVREDEHQAKAFADMFERAGLNVGGAPSADADLRRAGASVVVWSHASIRSRAFLDAAQRAVNAGKAVIACLIDPPPPTSINNSPCFDLRDWSGDTEDPALDPLFFAVDRMVTQARSGGAAAPVHEGGLAAAAAASAPARQPMAQTAAAAPPPYARGARAAPAPSFDPAPRQPTPLRAAPAAPAPSSDAVTAEAQHWKQIRHSRNAEDFLRHLAQFGPDGAFSELAQMRLDELQAQPPRAAASRAPRRPTQPAPTPPAAAAPRPVAPPRPAAPAPRPVARPAPAPMPPAGASIEPVWGEGAPLAAPRRPEPVQPAMGGFEPRYEPQQRPIYVDRAPVEPRRAGGMGRVVVVLAILGAGALGAGMWAGGGLSGLSLAGVTASNAPGDGEDWAAPVEQAEAATGTEGLTALAATTTQDASPAVAPAGVGGIEEDEPPPRPRTTASAAPSTFRPAQENSAALAPLPTPAAQVTPASAPQLQAPTPTPPQVRLRPGAVTWADRPSASRISALFPARALRENVSGRAELDCLILTTYQARCVVVSESPQGYGFGQAAMRASGGFRAERALDDGSPAVGARTRVAITFRAE